MTKILINQANRTK